MNLMNNEFDALVRKKLTAYEHQPADAIWKKIESQLQVSPTVGTQKAHKGLFSLKYIYRAVAALLICGVLSTVFVLSSDSIDTAQSKKISKASAKLKPAELTGMPIPITLMPDSKSTNHKVVVTQYNVPQFISNKEVEKEDETPNLQAPLVPPLSVKFEEISPDNVNEENKVQPIDTTTPLIKRHTEKKELFIEP